MNYILKDILGWIGLGIGAITALIGGTVAMVGFVLLRVLPFAIKLGLLAGVVYLFLKLFGIV